MVSRQSDGTVGSRPISAVLDLVAVVGVAIVLFGLISADLEGPVRTVFGFLFVLIVPGYAITAALFPRAQAIRYSWRTTQKQAVSLSLLERFVISVGISLFLVPILLLFLHYTPWKIAPETVLPMLLVVVLVSVAVGAVRRLQVPPNRRFRVPIEWFLSDFDSTDSTTRRVNSALAVLVILAGCIAGAGLATSQNGERYTEFYLLSEAEDSGELVAANYPSTLDPESQQTIHVGIANHESQEKQYTVLAEYQRVRTVEGDRIIVARHALTQYETTVQPGERDVRPVNLTNNAAFTGSQFRVTFMLYDGTVPENPDGSAATQQTHIWVSVPDTGGET